MEAPRGRRRPNGRFFPYGNFYRPPTLRLTISSRTVVEEVTTAIAEALGPAIDELAGVLGRDDDLVAVRRAIDKGVRASRRGLRAHGS